MTKRRDFLARLSVVAAAMTIDADELRAASASTSHGSPWDTSWIDKLATAQYRVVFNGSEMADGAALDMASTFLDHFHEVHGTTDKQTRPVIVFRRLGTEIGFNDAMWEKYSLGEGNKTIDPATGAPAKRNVYWKTAPGSSSDASTKIETLQGRGLIVLVCNIATENVGSRIADKRHLDRDEVRKDLKANLVPGATLVPSGIFALIRAQNAGCAYMPGT
jgi:intracellular sulfur oxidation DsrE/DsrF family protein